MAKAKGKGKQKPIEVALGTREGGKRVVCIARLVGNSVEVTTGPQYGKKKAKKHAYKTPEAARTKFDAIVAEHRGNGYRELGELPAPTVPIARDATLEAAIREDHADPAPYLVYADWLQGQGSPLGELIALQHGGKQRKANTIAEKIGLPDPDIATYGWRNGFWQWLRLENDADWMDTSFQPAPVCARIFASPLCAVLEELRIGILRWDYEDQPEILAEAGRHAWAKDLRRLHVGDVSNNIDMDHHAIGTIGKVVTKSFPNLCCLKLHSGSKSWSGDNTFGFAGLELPHLTDLAIETCAMNSKRMKMLTAAKLPALERLEVWFGSRDREATARTADVMPIFEGKLFPKLVHLGLRNSELVEDFVRLLPEAKIAKQLESLDLSLGWFGDDNATELAQSARAFPKLKALDVSESWLTPAGVRTLKTAFKGVKLRADEQRQPYDWNPTGRYVSVSE